MSVIASRTSRILTGPMITPVARRRPQILARQTTTLDLLARGRTVLGVGLGAPEQGDFGLFGDETDPKVRGEMLDEGLEVLAGLWSGEPFTHTGPHYPLGPVRFRPTPYDGPVPVWVGGVLPARKPLRRAARWQGYVPIAYDQHGLVRASVDQLAAATDVIRTERGSLDGYDVAVWAEVAEDPGGVLAELPAYEEVGVTWWIESAEPGRDTDWYAGLTRRIAAGPAGS